MLIDNKIDYSAVGIKSAHDFLLKNTGKGGLDIATGFFTVSALDWLSRLAPEKFRLVLAKIAGMDDGPSRIVNLLTGKSNIKSGFTLSSKAKGAIAFLKRDSVGVRTVDNVFAMPRHTYTKTARPKSPPTLWVVPILQNQVLA